VGSFFWEIGQPMQDLMTYMTSKGTVPAGWVIEQVTAVSADGKTIVGTGYNNDTYEGWRYHCEAITGYRWCIKKIWP
jgi:hypothetical protein